MSVSVLSKTVGGPLSPTARITNRSHAEEKSESALLLAKYTSEV